MTLLALSQAEDAQVVSSDARIAVVRAWSEDGQLRVRIVVERGPWGERLVFESARDAVRALYAWLIEISRPEQPDPRDGDGPVTPR